MSADMHERSEQINTQVPPNCNDRSHEEMNKQFVGSDIEIWGNVFEDFVSKIKNKSNMMLPLEFSPPSS